MKEDPLKELERKHPLTAHKIKAQAYQAHQRVQKMVNNYRPPNTLKAHEEYEHMTKRK